MSDRLPESKLDGLFPGLRLVAELISVKRTLDQQILGSIMSETGINGEKWAFSFSTEHSSVLLSLGALEERKLGVVRQAFHRHPTMTPLRRIAVVHPAGLTSFCLVLAGVLA